MNAPPIHQAEPSRLSRRCACGDIVGPEGECIACRAKRLQREAIAPPIVHDIVRGPGRPLDGTVRVGMERSFRHDFRQVRVHADSRAAASARAIDASAYTVGRNIVFGAGAYAPATGDGRRLLAHELAHVVQQSQAGEPGYGQQVATGDSQLEAEAETATARVTAGGWAPPLSRLSTPAVQRQWFVTDPTTGVPVFKGIQAYDRVKALPHSECTSKTLIPAGHYLLYPHQLSGPGGACSGPVVYYLAYWPSEQRREWVVGPDSLAAFTANIARYELLAQINYLSSPPVTRVSAFKGIQAFHLAESVPHADCADSRPKRAGGYLLYPHRLSGPADDCSGLILYYIAYRTSESHLRREWVVGPDSLAAFTANVARHALEADFTYQFTPPGAYLAKHHAEGVRAADKMMRGDVGGAFSSLGSSWTEAPQDPGWLASATATTTAGLTSAARPPATPTTGPTSFPVIQGGGTPAATLRPPTPVAASEVPTFPTWGSSALKAQPAPLPAPALPVRPPLKSVPLEAPAPVPVSPAAPAPAAVSPGAAAVTGAAVTTAIGPSASVSPAPSPRPAPQPAPDPTEDRQRRGCATLFPRATPIHWPVPTWHLTGIGDPGSQDAAYDLPQVPLLVKQGSTLYNPARPEVTRYRTRIRNPPFRLQVPPGWPIHHKWPLYLGGPGDAERAEGEYDAEGRTLASPNLVVLSPTDHTSWHRALVEQPRGPNFGGGPSEQTPDGTQFCVLDLMTSRR